MGSEVFHPLAQNGIKGGARGDMSPPDLGHGSDDICWGQLRLYRASPSPSPEAVILHFALVLEGFDMFLAGEQKWTPIVFEDFWKDFEG